MALKSIPIPMPEKKITFKKSSSGTVYVYLTIKAYRNSKGKPTSDEVAIGKKDVATGMLIPNRRYSEFFGCAKTETTTLIEHDVANNHGEANNTRLELSCEVASIGNVFLLSSVSQKLGLTDVLHECFPHNWERMLAVAFYMLTNGNVMMHIADWFDETDVRFSEPLSDKYCSELFASITLEQRNRFFMAWAKLRTEHEHIAYDVTSISTYSKGIDNAEWGYNRDNEALPQINLGLFTGYKSHLPIYYTTYNGSISDKTHLPFMMGRAAELGISKVRFVLDCGFVTEDNLKYMENEKHFFVTAFPKHFLETKKLIDSCKPDIRISENRLSGYDVYAKRTQTSVYGYTMFAHVFFDPAKQVIDEKELYAHIDRLTGDLEKIVRTKPASKRYTDFFMIEQGKPDSMVFALDHEKINYRLSQTGFFVLMTNDETLSSADVLCIYRGKDVIEKNFDQLKNGLDFKRLRTHLNRTTDGKIFVGFIALILRTLILRVIRESEDLRNVTFDKVMLELRKIRKVAIPNSQTLLTPITKNQRSILKAFGLSDDDLVASMG